MTALPIAGEERGDLLELAAGYAEESVIVTDADLDPPGPRILYVNTAFTRMTGYGAADLLGDTPRRLQGPDTDRGVLRALKAALRAGEDFVGRTVNYRRDRTPFELEWVISHLRDSSGRTTHYLAVQRDITGVERAQQGLREIDQELRDLGVRMVEAVDHLRRMEHHVARADRMSALWRLARGVTHDLNNDLGATSWLLAGLQEATDLEATHRERLRLARENLDEALQLVARLGEFAEADHAPADRIAVDLHELVDRVLAMTDPYRGVTARSVTVTSRVDQGLSVVGNVAELEHVLVNLVLNAFEAMPDGGELTVTGEARDGWAHLQLRDTGEGMDAEAAEQCFDPFVTSRAGRPGMGLAICDRLVGEHGGRIDVESRPGGGTTIRVSLPSPDVAPPG